ncbi:uncharacterized protein BDV17DRAFT_255961, partial [Aspergillus undulatus]|uniref:uncharacterized protein n=1 Tax=Aspergillus undulatus TaxID=1810928 RepID=UPI003CCD5ABC
MDRAMERDHRTVAHVYRVITYSYKAPISNSPEIVEDPNPTAIRGSSDRRRPEQTQLERQNGSENI